MKKINFFYSWLVWFFTFFIPDAPIAMRFRGWLYSFGMKCCGHNFQVASGVRILGLSKLEVGCDVFIAAGVVINARELICIESEVMIGIGSLVVSSLHTKKDNSYRFGEAVGRKIFIGKGTWIAGHVVIGGGASIPNGCLIAANSFVSKVISTPGIYAGTPVKLIDK
ncbi:acyltransferase [Shewanella algae]|uniref:acyltransferase n=1 Tax=Shewanella algae TaxID=38313 RepID=UPI003AAEFAAB